MVGIRGYGSVVCGVKLEESGFRVVEVDPEREKTNYENEIERQRQAAIATAAMGVFM